MTDFARLVLGADTQGLKAAERDLQSIASKAGKTASDIGSSMQRMGLGLTAGVTAPLVIFGKTAFDAAVGSRQAFAQVESALASMGAASGKTVSQLQKSAGVLQDISTFDDDDILQKVTANLLTFGNVAGDEFDRAQLAAVNLSARLGTDLQSATLQVGKALNDPIAGLTGLSRAGIQFTSDQKAMIEGMVEAGDIAGAQSIILGELERQFGGAAAAAREATPGSDQIQAWRTLQEVVGERLIVAFEKLEEITAPVINSFLALDEDTQTVIIVIGALAAALGPLLIVLGAMASGLGALVTIAPTVAAAFGIIRIAALALMANPVILAFAVVLGGIYLAWQNWDKIEPILRRLYEGAKKWILNGLGYILEYIKNPIGAVTNAFKAMYIAVVGNSYVPDMVDGISREFDRLQAVMVDPARKAASDVKTAMKAMADDVAAMGVTGLSIADRDARLAAIGGRPLDEIEELEKAASRWANAQNDLKAKSESTAVTIAESFGQMADRTLQAFDRMVGAIRGGGFLDILGSVINLGLQLGGMGAFGKTVQDNINKPFPSAEGGGFTGMGARAGGLDGKGGFLAMLHPRESVLDHTKGQGMGGRFHVTVGVDPRSGNLTAFVNDQIAATAPAIAGAGAAMAQGQMAARAQRRIR